MMSCKQIRKEAVVANMKFLSWNAPGRNEENITTPPPRTLGTVTDIRNMYLRSINLHRYHCTLPFGLQLSGGWHKTFRNFNESYLM
jgi:hypothetical protein